MSLLASDLEAVDVALDVACPKSRDTVLFTLVDWLCNPKGPVSPEHAGVYDQVVCWLTRHRDAQTRAAVANRLAQAQQGPAATVRNLAFDLCPEVAAPVLRHSPLLEEDCLIDIASVQGEEHLCAIAARTPVTQPVTDVVVRRGSWPVLRAVAANATAALSRSSLYRLARAAYGDGAITLGLLQRKDLPSTLTPGLLIHYNRLVESHQLDQRGEDSVISLEEIEIKNDSGMAVARECANARENLAIPNVAIEAPERHGDVAESHVAWCLNQGRWTDALVLVARLAEQPPEFVMRAFTCLVPDNTLLILRAADLSWPMARRLLHQARGSDPDGAIARQSAAYSELSQHSARRALRIFRLKSA